MKQITSLWLLMFFFASTALFAQTASTGLAKQAANPDLDQQKMEMMQNLNAETQPGVLPGVNQTNGNHYSKFQGPNGTRDVLYDNGPFVTAEGVGSNGTDYSELQDASLGMGTYGSGVQLSAGNSLADEFEVTGTWIVNSITVYGYQTGSGPPSTLTGVYMQIWDGDPTAGGSVIWGDLTTNIMESTEWTNAWRVLESGPTENRPIMAAVAEIGGEVFNAGTYWIEYSLDGSGASGPWNPPVTIVGETTTGNALQNQSGTWVALEDVGPQGIPFVVEGFEGQPPANDVSISAIVEPVSGVDLTAAEPVTITIKNNGTDEQSDIPYEVTWDGPTGTQTVSGTFAGPLASGATEDVTLAETADLSAYGTYDFEACTMLAGDEYPDNDCKTKTVTNDEPSLCIENLYTSGCGFGDGLISWSLENIEVPDIPCSGTPEWYHDYTDQVHNLPPGDYDLTVVAGYGSTYFDVWIDFNDDLLLTDDELVLDDAVCTDANVPYVFTVSVPSGAAPGQHVLRFRTNWIDPVLDPCETYSYGNCCDFSALIGDAPANDVGVTSIDMATFYEPGMVTPMATVKNFGTDTQTFDVTLTIDGYSSTMNVAGLASGATEQVTFDDWNATEGSFTAEACTDLSGDENPNNDCKTLGITVMEGQFVYAYNAYDPSGALVEGPVSFDLALPGMVNLIAPTTSTDFIAGGCWAADTWWGVQYGGGLYTIDTETGDMTLVGSSPDCSGLAFDGSTVYGASITDLYTIDPATGQGTMIGPMGNTGALMIGIGCDAAGNLYGFDIGDDNFYSIDKVTGAATLVGSTGQNFNYAQDMSFDKANDVCYLSGYTTTGGLYTVDVATGAATLLGEFQGGAEITGFAIPGAGLPPAGPPPTAFDANFFEGSGVETEWIDPQEMGTWIGYDDGENVGGLGLNGGGEYWAAIRWEPADLTPFDGQYITKFQFFPSLFAVEADITFMIWEGADAATMVYEQVLSNLDWDEWNTIMLDAMHTIDASQELWIGFHVVHADGEYPLGYDEGPAVAGYGDMVSFDGVDFVSMANEYSIDNNFNLHAFVAEETDGVISNKQPLPMPGATVTNTELATTELRPTEAPTNSRGFVGINIYRDGMVVNADPVAPGVQAYTDAFFENGTYMYYATAVYDDGESVPTAMVEVTIDMGAGPEISVTPESMYETHVVPPAQQTTQELMITNTGTETLDWEIELDLGRGAEPTMTPMDPAEYQQLLNERMLAEGVALPSTGLAPRGSYEPLTGATGNPLNTRETFYAYNAYDPSGALAEGPAYFDSETPGVITQLAPTTSSDFIAGGCWAADVWWGVQYGGGLYTIDNETGDMTFVGNSPDCSGLAFDGTTVYGASITDLYEIDPATGQGTMIGSMGNPSGLMIAIACDANGDLYGFDIGDDTFYSIDKGTGAATAIGVMGPNFNYAQDMAFDKDNDVCYLAGYTTAGGLYTVDVATGAATLVGEFQGGAEMTAMAIPYAGVTYENDISLSSIVSPVTGVELSAAEDVIIKIKNNGTAPQSGFDWEVTWDGPTGPGSYSGVYSETLAAGESVEANVGTADLSVYGDYTFEACVTLVGDENPDNDCKTKMVTNNEPSLCIDGLYTSGCGFGDGLISWNFANVDVPDIPCSGTPEWYHDYTDMVHAFDAGETYTLTVVAGYASTNFDVWIDWNDDLDLTDDEIILNDGACTDANVPYTFEVTIPADAPGGDHILRFRTNWIDPVLDACETYSYGNCCDFKANAGGGQPSEWLSVDMMSGSVEPGDTQTVMVMFDSEGLDLGLYEGMAMVTSNATNTPTVEVSCTLDVTDEQLPVAIEVDPESLTETHTIPGPQVTTQEVTITNTGETDDLDWEIAVDLGTSPSQHMDAEEYARLLEERQAYEGQPANDVQYGVTPGYNVTGGNHYSKFQVSDGTRDVLYDNGPFITAEGVGSNGSDYSELQDASLGMGTYGSGVQLSAGNSLADEFEVTGTWIVNSITVYGYQTGSGPPSTLTGVYMQIWDGNPTSGGSVIWGDLTTNIMSSTEWTNVWRVLESGPTENRPIMQVVADLGGLALNAGTYWIEYSLDGTGASGPWNPPVTIVGETTTGNALQNQSGTWVALEDVGPQGIPFIVEGFEGQQPGDDVSISAIVEPMSGVELGSAEPITITLKNNGTNAQTSIPWEVSYDGPTGMETFSGTWTGNLASGESLDVTLAETADLSAFGDYDFEACTMLPGDEYPDNDCKTKTVTNDEPSLCVDNLYTSGCGFGDGLISWNFANIDVPDIPCSGTPEWYHDYTDMVHEFNAGETYTLTVVAGYATTNFDVWIDWNDDLLLTDDELILDDGACADANVPYTFEVTIPSSATGGDHILRFRTNWIDPVVDPCETYSYGNCCDFKANAGGGSGGDDWLSVDMMSGSLSPGQSETVTVTFNSEDLAVGVYNGALMITSNAQNNPMVEVPCTLTVEEEGGNTVVFEPFEDYVADDYLVAQAIAQGKEYWTTWSESPGGAEDPFVKDDQAYEGSNSMVIEGTNDAVLIMPENYSSGQFNIDFMVYIPTGKIGYFNALQLFAGTASEWGMQAYFDVGGAGLVDAGGAGAGAFTYTYDTWHNVEMMIDLDADNAEMYFNGDMIVQWQWSTGSFGTGTLNEFHAMNFYAWAENGTPGAYFDNIDITKDGGGELPDPPINFVGTDSGSDALLSWEYPGIFEPTWITYSGEEITNSIGTNAAANFDVAARWEPADLTGFENGAVTKINFVPGEPGDICTYTLKVWQGAGNPTLIYEQELTEVVADVWNEVTLDTPVPFDNTQELWIGFNNNTTAGFPAGCDDGPQDEGLGNMMFWEGSWVTLTSLNPDLIYNWAVQGYIEFAGDAEALLPIEGEPVVVENEGDLALNPVKITPPAIFIPESARSLTFNVYRDGVKIAEEITGLSYIDSDLNAGTYVYYATAVVDDVESNPSNEATVVITSINELAASSFKVYPNPTNGVVNIESDLELKSVKLVNLTGQVVYSAPVNGSTIQFNASEFTTGVYTLQIETEVGVAVHKLIIQ